MKKTPTFVFVAILIFTTISCKVNYSFTGASIAPEVKTIRITNFPNNALLVHPTLAQDFTDALRNKFQSQTSLNIVTKGGDLVIEGEITDYNTRPTAIQADDIAAQNRLTVTVKVTFTNNNDDSQSFTNQSFSRYQDYPSSLDFNSVQDTYLPQIIDYLVEDIFNKAVVNW